MAQKLEKLKQRIVDELMISDVDIRGCRRILRISLMKKKTNEPIIRELDIHKDCPQYAIDELTHIVRRQEDSLAKTYESLCPVKT